MTELNFQNSFLSFREDYVKKGTEDPMKKF